MPVRYPGVLLVLFFTLFHDMGDSSPVRTKRSHCSWNEIKKNTRNLNDLTFKFYNKEEAIRDTVLNNIPRIECHHQCGPETLIVNEKPCLKRIFHILSYYNNTLSNLHMTKVEDSKREDIIKIKEFISALLQSLWECGYENQNETFPINNRTDQFVINHIGYPLVSFSSLIARVFSPGNPNNHIVV